VDTAGMSQRDLRLGEALASLQGAGLRSYLTLASNAHETMLDETIGAFGKLPLSGCVLTKLDECPSLGAALSAVIRHRLPVACITDGQRVPEDLRPARARDLVSIAAQRMHARAEQAAAVAPAPAVATRRVAAHA
jgi:flagellar biosynthesis protein FlhF